MTRDPSNCAAPNNDVLARPGTAYTSAKSRSRLTGVVLASPEHLRQANSPSLRPPPIRHYLAAASLPSRKWNSSAVTMFCI